MTGAVIDYVITGVDRINDCCTASRKMAMDIRRKTFLKLEPQMGRKVPVNVLAVGGTHLLATCNGFDMTLSQRDLSYGMIDDLRNKFHPGEQKISTIVASKLRPARAASGYTGIYLDKRSGKWIANINFQKKRYYLGRYNDINKAIDVRKRGEERLHDPMITQYWDTLTPKKQREYLVYIQE